MDITLSPNVIIGLLVGLVAGLVALRTSERKIQIENVTQERTKWRAEIRKLMISAHIAACSSDVSRLGELVTEFSINLNPSDLEDVSIITNIYKLSLAPNDSDLLLELRNRVTLLLKHDWERGKYESRPWFFQVLPPKRLSYEEFKSGQGKEKHSFIYYLSRQLILCFVVSSIPIYIAYKTCSEHKDIIPTIKNKIIPDDTTQLIIVFILIIYLIFTFSRNRISKNNTTYGKIGAFVFGIIKKLSTSFENTLQLFSGIIFILSFLWIYWEPDTVNYLGLVFIISIGFSFLSSAALFDKFDDNNR